MYIYTYICTCTDIQPIYIYIYIVYIYIHTHVFVSLFLGQSPRYPNGGCPSTIGSPFLVGAPQEEDDIVVARQRGGTPQFWTLEPKQGEPIQTNKA